MLNTNIRSKLVPIKLLGYKLVVYKNILKLKMNKDVYCNGTSPVTVKMSQ